jgi:hypothetical protein
LQEYLQQWMREGGGQIICSWRHENDLQLDAGQGLEVQGLDPVGLSSLITKLKIVSINTIVYLCCYIYSRHNLKLELLR